jgi:exopolysaccharide production protein ExoQ
MRLTWRDLEQAFAVFAIMLLTDGLALRSVFVAPEGSQNVSSTVGGLDSLIAWSQYGILAVTLFFLATGWRRTIQVIGRNPFLLLFAIYTALSVYWSDFPAITTRSGLLFVSTTLFGIYLANRYSIREQLKLVAVAMGLLGLMSLLIAGVMPSAAIEQNNLRQGSWRGVFYHKNNLGLFMYLGVITAMLSALDGDRVKARLIAWSSCAIAFGLLVLSSSKTSLLIILILMALIPFTRSLRWQPTQLITLLTGVVLIGGSVAVGFVENYESLLLGLGKDPSLSGRTDIWATVWQSAMERPWFGYGYEAFWVEDAGKCLGECAFVRATLRFDATSAHNGYVDLMASLGFVGVALFGLGLFVAYNRAIRTILSGDGYSELWPFLYLVSLVLFTQSESALFADRSVMWALYVGVGLTAPGQCVERRTSQSWKQCES